MLHDGTETKKYIYPLCFLYNTQHSTILPKSVSYSLIHDNHFARCTYFPVSSFAEVIDRSRPYIDDTVTNKVCCIITT